MNKLQKIMKFKEGMPIFYEYLHNEGYSSQLLYKYVKNGWLERVSSGVFKRVGKSLDQLSIVKAMQEQLELKCHIGAQGALELHGKVQYLKYKTTLPVFIPVEYKVSLWLKSIKELTFVKNNIFKDNLLGLSNYEKGGLKISSLERAYIEMASFVGTKATYTNFYECLEFSTTLRSELIQKLLESCTSVKAKRIFLCASEKLGYKWFAQLNLKKIGLGSGIRQVVKNGRYNKKYKICIDETAE